MSSLLKIRRRHGHEILDDPRVPGEVIVRSMSDVARANALFGGKRAAMAELRPVIAGMVDRGSFLDVGTGNGDIPAAARHESATAGIRLWTVGLDFSEHLLNASRYANDAVVRADALLLPLRDRSVDAALCSQLLHHFRRSEAITLVRELNRVARVRVIISDLRRSILAAAGLWAASFPLRFHPVSRHDGVVSVMRGFLPHELADIVEAAIGRRPRVRRRLGFRLTTSWKPE